MDGMSLLLRQVADRHTILRLDLDVLDPLLDQWKLGLDLGDLLFDVLDGQDHTKDRSERGVFRFTECGRDFFLLEVDVLQPLENIPGCVSAEQLGVAGCTALGPERDL